MTTSALLNEGAILFCVCDEPNGDVVRQVRFMTLDLDNLKELWEKSSKYTTLFGEEVSRDFTKFTNLILKQGPRGIEPQGLFWVVDDFVGVFYLTRIDAGVDAIVHYSFFDGRTKGRAGLTKEMIKYVMQEYGFRRLSAEIPYYASPAAFKFAEEVGFRHEGRRRQGAFYQGKWFDVNCMGLLRSEIL